ncbi:Replication gene A protein, partial [Salmonella enterica subsp. enterica serovar Senftenberg str. A4-543]
MAVSKITLHYVQTTGGSNEAAAAFPWNTPKKAVNPYLDPAEVAPESALSNLIALYAADNEQEPSTARCC